MITDLYLRFASADEAKTVFGSVVVSDPVKSKEIAVSIAKDRVKRAWVEFETIGEPAEAFEKGLEFVVDEKVPLTRADLDLNVEDAALAVDWKPEELPIDGQVLGLQFDLIQVGTVWDPGPIVDDVQTFVPRLGYHVLARFRGEGEAPAAILSYETTPWNQVIG